MAEEAKAAEDGNQAPQAERRVRVRYTQSLKSFCQKGSGELDQIWWMGRVRDISGTGVGLVIQHRFEPDTHLLLELENPAHARSSSYQVRVIRATSLPDGRWLLGCAFLQELSESELAALL